MLLLGECHHIRYYDLKRPKLAKIRERWERRLFRVPPLEMRPPSPCHPPLELAKWSRITLDNIKRQMPSTSSMVKPRLFARLMAVMALTKRLPVLFAVAVVARQTSVVMRLSIALTRFSGFDVINMQETRRPTDTTIWIPPVTTRLLSQGFISQCSPGFR